MPPIDPIDLLTFGESLIRLSTPTGQLLAESPTLDIHIAGAESNVAVAVSRMNYRARWFSRLTDNFLGQRIVREIAGYGVDCAAVAWTAEDRVGAYYLEPGIPPRPARVIYDRAYSAASKMDASTFTLDLLNDVRVLHVTGITAALSDGCYALVSGFLDEAARRGIHTVLDVNFRALLWSAQSCAEKLSVLMPNVKTLVLSKRDALTVFGIQGEPLDVLFALQNQLHVSQIALTTAEAGAVGIDGDSTYTALGYPVQIVDRIGAGDAFAAGVICGLLEDDFAQGLRYGVAMSALQLTLAGDLFRLTKADVNRLMQSGTQSGAAHAPLR